ncbi:P22AR C-terminal domain-containing protein [Haemophilus influenzae]|uniref:P22AR C-terminal domain-containing protein n=1 Tax=Haemophilus influenzae TaxID=727 RepID=UPI00215634BB|nr:P22AR C-terminal domain-containing protein [Haemophilus influenzae]
MRSFLEQLSLQSYCNINPHKAIKDHVDPDDLTKREVVNTINKRAQVLFVNESGMYSLVLSSKLEQAKKVKRWVTSEVLPAIRKTGKYQLQPQQLALPEPEKFTHELTEFEIETLVWLLRGHHQMNTLLGQLEKPLDAIGSNLHPAVYSYWKEYGRQYKDALPTIKRLMAPFKQSNRLNWARAQHLINQ